MPIEQTQKLAFKIYDRNQNGVIDERDILELMDIVDENQAMKEDFYLIIKHYHVDQEKSMKNSSQQKIDSFS